MPDDRPATELWDALVLTKGEYPPQSECDATEDVALKGYRDVLVALEEASRHKDACLIVHEALATERARLLEALNA